MRSPLEYIYEFADGEDHDATLTANSLSLNTCFNYNFHVAITPDGLTGIGAYTFQVSDDEVNWYDYATEFTNVSTEDAVEDANALTWKYSRIKYSAGTASAGTVKFKLTLKSH